MQRVLLIANRDKPEVVEAMKAFRPWLEQRAQIIAEPDACSHEPITLPGDPRPATVIVLGGDGTLLSQARRVADLEMPLIGVNFGKLGFLAEFSLEDLQTHWDTVTSTDAPVSRRLLIETQLYTNGDDKPAFRSLAMNDCVITAGRPFRMIDLELKINPHRNLGAGTGFGGDGVIVATPSGSTAHNASAGGPILAPDVEAMIVTPICPQSLAFRSIVVHGDDAVVVTLRQANAGTTLVIDGQVTQPLAAGDRIRFAGYPQRIRIVKNPAMGYWTRLAKKMNWAVGPGRNL